MEVIVLGSDCVMTQKYVELVKRRLDALRRYGVVVASTDAEVHDHYGVQDRCKPGICPGCGFLFPMKGAYLPALVVNGKVELHSRFPSVNEVNVILKRIK